MSAENRPGGKGPNFDNKIPAWAQKLLNKVSQSLTDQGQRQRYGPNEPSPFRELPTPSSPLTQFIASKLSDLDATQQRAPERIETTKSAEAASPAQTTTRDPYEAFRDAEVRKKLERERHDHTFEELDNLQVPEKLTAINRDFWGGAGTVSRFDSSLPNNSRLGNRLVGYELVYDNPLAAESIGETYYSCNRTSFEFGAQPNAKHAWTEYWFWRIWSENAQIRVGVFRHRDLPDPMLVVNGGMRVEYPAKDYNHRYDPNVPIGYENLGPVQAYTIKKAKEKQAWIQRLYGEVFPFLKKKGVDSATLHYRLGFKGTVGIRLTDPDAAEFVDNALALDHFIRTQKQQLPKDLEKMEAHLRYLRLTPEEKAGKRWGERQKTGPCTCKTNSPPRDEYEKG